LLLKFLGKISMNTFSVVRIIIVLNIALLINACGGGGGSSSSTSSDTFTLSTDSLNFSAQTPTSIVAAQPITGTVNGNLSGTLYILISESGSAVSSISNVIIDNNTQSGTANVTPTNPSILGIGTHSSTITVRACLNDPTCASGELSGSPKTISVTYTISNGAYCADGDTSNNGIGSVDKTFCGSGLSLFNSISRTYKDDQGNAIEMDVSGKYLVAGYTHNSIGNFDIALWRFNVDGSLDESFGTNNGFSTYDSGIGSFRSDEARDIKIDNSNRIIVAGYTPNGTDYNDLILLRYFNNGLIDTSFGINGVVTHNNAAGGNTYDEASSIIIDDSNRILVAGRSINSFGNFDMVVWRFIDDGSLDISFGGDYNSDGIKDGFFIHDNAAAGNGNDFGTSITLDSIGRIIVAGSSKSTGNPSGYDDIDMVVWRFLEDGTLDTSFGGNYDGDLINDGYFKHDGATTNNSYDGASEVLVDAAGSIIVVGSSFNNTSNYNMVLWKLDSSGTLDTSFGGDYNSNGTKDGFVRYSSSNTIDEVGTSLKIDGNDKIVVVGYQFNNFASWRYHSDGSLDTTFGTNGVSILSTKPFGGRARDMLLDSNGRIVVTGSVYIGGTSGHDLAVWRLTP